MVLMKKIAVPDLGEMAESAAGKIDRIFLHWSAGHYHQAFADYHININADGEIYISTDDLAETKDHTWRQNSGAVGIAILCCAFAATNNLGNEPPTQAQIETMAQVVAVLCQGLGFPCNYDHVRTHAEQADLDGYGPATTCERWDLWFLSEADRTNGGDIIRGKANWYIEQGII